jgi:hypothetical protein
MSIKNKEFFQTHSETSITLIPKPNKDITKKKTSGHYSFEHRCKISQENTRKKIQQHIKRIVTTPCEFMPDKDGLISVNQ